MRQARGLSSLHLSGPSRGLNSHGRKTGMPPRVPGATRRGEKKCLLLSDFPSRADSNLICVYITDIKINTQMINRFRCQRARPMAGSPRDCSALPKTALPPIVSNGIVRRRPHLFECCHSAKWRIFLLTRPSIYISLSKRLLVMPMLVLFPVCAVPVCAVCRLHGPSSRTRVRDSSSFLGVLERERTRAVNEREEEISRKSYLGFNPKSL